MTYLKRKTILERQFIDGIRITILEGLNNRLDYEVELIIPKELQVQFDEKPAIYDKWQLGDSMLYFGVNGKGVVSFYAYSGPGRGYGGAHITLNTVDGEETLIGPWSSRCGVMNHAFQASMEIVLVGKYRMASAMTFSALNKYLRQCGFICEMRKSHGDWKPYIAPLYEVIHGEGVSV